MRSGSSLTCTTCDDAERSEQDSLIYSFCSSLSSPSDLLLRPTFSTQVAQKNFYFRPNLTFLLTPPPRTSSAKRFFVTFPPLSRLNFKRRQRVFWPATRSQIVSFLSAFADFVGNPHFRDEKSHFSKKCYLRSKTDFSWPPR